MNNYLTLKPVQRPPLLHEAVKDSILAYILDNQLQPGDQLPPEGELSRQLGVSRNSVREGVKALESLGVVETQRGSGVFVKNFSFDPLIESLPYGLLTDLRELRDLLEVRRILETSLLESAITTTTDEQVARLKQVVEVMRQRAEEGIPLVQEDRDFHHTLFDHLENKILLKLLDVFWLAYRKAVELGNADVLRDPDPVKTYYAHAAIAAAVEARDIEEACTALKKHYDDGDARLLKAHQQRKA